MYSMERPLRLPGMSRSFCMRIEAEGPVDALGDVVGGLPRLHTHRMAAQASTCLQAGLVLPLQGSLESHGSRLGAAGRGAHGREFAKLPRVKSAQRPPTIPCNAHKFSGEMMV